MTEPLSGAIEIRPVAAADHDAWLPLWRGYQLFYKADIPMEATRATWRRFHDPEEPIWAALAWSGESAVGMVHWIFHRSTWAMSDYCYLQDRSAGVTAGIRPNQRAKPGTAWCSSIPRPPTVRCPSSRLSRSRAVSSGT